MGNPRNPRIIAYYRAYLDTYTWPSMSVCIAIILFVDFRGFMPAHAINKRVFFGIVNPIHILGVPD